MRVSMPSNRPTTVTAPTPQDEPLLRQFTWFGIWLLIVNGMIGAGIFGLPGEAARLTGAWSPLLFVFCGLLIGTVMLSFGEVASHFRNTGGPILYLRTAFGPLAGFETGWALYLARITAFGANLNLLVTSIAYFHEPIGEGATRIVLMAAICAALTWVNMIGARTAMRSVLVLTVLKFFPLLILVGFGLSYLTPDSFAPVDSAPAFTQFGAAALVVIYAYVGFESALIPAGETQEPDRAMRRALLWGLVIVTILYALIQAVSLAVLPDLANSARPLVDVGAALLGPVGAMIVGVGVVVSVGGNAASSVFSAPRITYAMGRDGTLPAFFGAVHPEWKTPHISVLIYGVGAFALAIWGSFIWLAAMSAVTRLLIYVASIAALPMIRRDLGEKAGKIALPGGYTIPALAVALSIWLLAQATPEAFAVTGGFLVVGAALYWFSARKRQSQIGSHM